LLRNVVGQWVGNDASSVALMAKLALCVMIVARPEVVSGVWSARGVELVVGILGMWFGGEKSMEKGNGKIGGSVCVSSFPFRLLALFLVFSRARITSVTFIRKTMVLELELGLDRSSFSYNFLGNFDEGITDRIQ